MRKSPFIAAAIVFVAMSAIMIEVSCVGEDATPANTAGTAGSACLPNGTCNVGLACTAGTCVVGDGDGGASSTSASSSSSASSSGSSSTSSSSTSSSSSSGSSSGSTDAASDAHVPLGTRWIKGTLLGEAGSASAVLHFTYYAASSTLCGTVSYHGPPNLTGDAEVSVNDGEATELTLFVPVNNVFTLKRVLNQNLMDEVLNGKLNVAFLNDGTMELAGGLGPDTAMVDDVCIAGSGM